MSPWRSRLGRRAGALAAVALLGCGSDNPSETILPTATRALAAGSTLALSSAAPLAPRAACPPEMAHVDRFCVDRHEAHLVDAADPARVLSPYDRPGPETKARAASAAGVVPQGYLNRFEAAAACAAAGKRLCAAPEWYRACAGPKGRRYPYGDEPAIGRCNVGKGHVMQKVFGTSVHYTFDSHYNSPRLNREPGFLSPSGEHAECVTEDGVFDMVGNLHEWVADDVTNDLAKRMRLEIGAERVGSVGNGIFMGGYYSSHGEHGAGCAYATTAHKPDYHDYSIGFRCCADAR